MWDTYRDRKNFLSDDNSLRHRHSILSGWNIWSEVVRKDHFYTHYREGTPVKHPHHCHLSSCYIIQITLLVLLNNHEQTLSHMWLLHIFQRIPQNPMFLQICRLNMKETRCYRENKDFQKKKNEKIPTGSFYSANGTELVSWPILVHSNLQARGIHMQRRWS